MPLYEYECRTCKRVFEAYRRRGHALSNPISTTGKGKARHGLPGFPQGAVNFCCQHTGVLIIFINSIDPLPTSD